ncbi:MBL fold metallo-hydrolase [Alcanivorax sp.]|uniref:MBL fold metallo-hydrolase n=1 Tax=Alcanivorax sp. TaxID=1872427 RepID=UPI000C451605|nr:MBL fold metallo-hydrolase [Alcanivorax sp.]MBU84238.1 MBL fold metallo-hydrolase [Alcanivorax sp.]|tara:strand:- start:505 stop:2196 length:1692 start_codon:yes stop_codon:yes gene_type:complete
MEVNFIGPLGKVTGSCTWMRDLEKGWNFLIDCGMQQGENTADAWNHQEWPFDPSEIQFIVLTHAHMDHSGLIPSLYESGFNGKVYCTEETASIAEIQYRNAMHLSPELFTQASIDKIKWSHFQKEPILGGHHPVDQDLFLQFQRTGHILGAVSVSIYWGKPMSPEQRSIVFSGDIGPQPQDNEVLPIIRHTMNPGHHNYAVMESTYGSTNRSPSDKEPVIRRDHLKSLIDRTINTQGTLLIPAFALGRSQDVLFDLHAIAAENPKYHEQVDFYYDFPLGREIMDETIRFWAKTESNREKTRLLWLGKQVFDLLGLTKNDPDHLQQAVSAMNATSLYKDDCNWKALQEGNQIAKNWKPIISKRLPTKEVLASSNRPTVIVTGSGNGDAGKAAAWLPLLLPKNSTIVATTGYFGSNTVSGKLISIKDLPTPDRRMSNNNIEWPNSKKNIAVAEIRAHIQEIKGYSAHGDQEDLLNWAVCNAKEGYLPAGDTIFLQHGDDQNREALRDALRSKSAELGIELDIQTPNEKTGWISLESEENNQEDEDYKNLMALLKKRPDLKQHVGN